MSLLEQIRRRNVHRVALAYLAGAWLLIQIAETIFPLFDLPSAATRAIVVVLTIGFVPALVLSWIFEWTPQGLVRETDVPAGAVTAPTRQLDRAIIVLLVLAVGYFAIDKFLIDPARDKAEIAAATENALALAQLESFGDRSIAVLPFVNMSPDPDQEYFADGISEELLNLLARIPELRVISRSTAFTFKGQDVVIPEAAKKMKVAHILEGSVRKAGDKIRITVQLIDARTDTHLWSETYDRTLDDIFAIQDEISARVVAELKLQLLGGPPTAQQIDPHAYDLFLEARHIVATEWDGGYLPDAELKLRRALAIEPDFVPAIWMLARTIYRQDRSRRRDRDSNDTTRADREFRSLVARLVEIAPDSSYANGWLAHLALYEENDPQKAAHYYERAVAGAVDINLYKQLEQCARLLWMLGRRDEAAAIGLFVSDRDPACTSCILNAAYWLRELGHYREAAEWVEGLLQWHEPINSTLWTIGAIRLVAGEPEIALQYFDRLNEPPGNNLGRVLALYSLGRNVEFEQEFALLQEFNQDNPEAVARVYAWTGQNDLAFEYLERMVDLQGSVMANDVKSDMYARLYSDPRWQEFLERNDAANQDYSHIEFNPKLPPEVQAALEEMRQEK